VIPNAAIPRTGERTTRQRCTGKVQEEEHTEPSELLEGRMEVNSSRIGREHPNCDQNHVRGYRQIMHCGPHRAMPQGVCDLIGQEEDGHGEEEDVP